MSLEMLTEAEGESLGLRFFLTRVMPAALLAVLTFLIVGSGALHHSPSLHDTVTAIDKLDAGRITILVLAILALTVLLQPFQIAVVKALEGYWGRRGIMQLITDVGIELQRRRYEALESMTEGGDDQSPAAERRQDWAAAQLRFYPRVSRLLPTRLGNTMRACEDRAGGRYGLATVATWPRLHAQLSERLFTAVGDARSQLDTSARLCVTFAAATVLSIALLTSHGGWWLLIVTGSAVLLLVFAYRSAIASARVHGQLLEAAYDLHRFDMIAALHYQLPPTDVVEIEFNRRLSEFFLQAEEWYADSSDPYLHLRPRPDYDHRSGRPGQSGPDDPDNTA